MEPGIEDRKQSNHRDEDTSRRTMNYGRYFVPAREMQMRMMVDTLRGLPPASLVLEMCCGESNFAEMPLDDLPEVNWLSLDSSKLMLEQAPR
jgi:ubiquinone/menaquinone biosynthesis C-methylase UbiE